MNSILPSQATLVRHRTLGLRGWLALMTLALGGLLSAAPAQATNVRYVKLEALSEVNGNPWTSMAEFNLLDASHAVIPRTGWAVSADSVETQEQNGAAANAIDGNAATMWHTQFYPTNAPLPHSFVVDMGSLREVGGFKYLPRSTGPVNGRIATWRLHTSVDGSNWNPVAQGSFVNDATEKVVYVDPSPPAGAVLHVKLEALSEVNGNPWTSMAEFNLLNASRTVISRTGWTVSADSAESQEQNGAAANAIDGNAATMWHTQFYPTAAPLPHAFTVHLSTASVLGGFKYLPRNDGPPHGRIATWRLHTSVDGTSWSQVAQGRFVNDGAEKVVYLSLPTSNLPPPSASPTPVLNYEYDAEGNPTKTVQASGVSGFGFTTQNTFDALNRLKDSTNAKSGVTQFAYNGREDLTQVTDPRSLVTQTPRNGLGDTTSLVSPDTGTASHTYDAAGNLATRTDSRGVLATHSHDVLNRPTGVVYTQSSSSQTFGWSYDQTGSGYANGVGRLTSTSHPRGSTQYTYDAQGRVLNDTQRVSSTSGANSSQVSRTVSYGYDTAGHVTSIVYPSGRKLFIDYIDGLPTALSLAASSSATRAMLIDQVQWQAFGGVKRWQWQLTGGPQLHERIYDASGRLVRYRLGEVVRDLSYDAADRITGYTHLDATTGTATTPATALNQSFSYDELGRLTGITTATATWSLGYDANGNRTSVTLSGTTSTYTTASTSNRLNSITNPARSFGYDNAGNTTSDSGGYTSTYDLSGRLATLTKAGVTTTYSYDGLGRRVRKFSSTGASSTVIFVYDQAGQLLGEYDQSGTAIREYVWLGSTPVAVFTPDPASGTNPPLVYYIHADHLDTPRVVTDTAGNLRWRWLAEPFGTTAPETNPASIGAFTQNLRFPGQYADQESGLSYNYFRDYDASIGRYVQSDPIGLEGGINTYSYVGGMPTMYVDLMGLMGSGGGGSAGGGRGGVNCTCSAGDSGSGYWNRVMDNYKQTTDILPWWTSLPGLNPLTPFTTGAVADAFGGMTFAQAETFRGTTLIGNARLAAGLTSVINGTLVMGALHTGMLAGSMISPRVIQQTINDMQCR